MNETKRTNEYAGRGDYHRHLDPHWSYAPIYRKKVRWVDEVLKSVPISDRLIDIGSGEGALVERYRQTGRNIIGVDTAYESPLVQRVNLLTLPFDDDSFDVVLLLDVLEHLQLPEQSKALVEMRRVLKRGGILVMTVPNLAHLHSRIKFLCSGKLTRTSAVERHPGDRPVSEYMELLSTAGFTIEQRGGIFPTVPIAFKAVNSYPKQMGWLVDLLDTCLPFPSLAFLNTILARS